MASRRTKTTLPGLDELHCLSDDQLQFEVQRLSSVTSSNLMIKSNVSWLLGGSVVVNSLENDAVNGGDI